MPDSVTLYTNPQSRGQIARWMLEEIGEPYETVVLGYDGAMKTPEYLAINPMGKVPAIRHRGRVVTETAAICAYLAGAFPQAHLAPPAPERGDYYRWLFFAAGPVEAAFSNRAMGWAPPPEREMMFGYGTYDRAMAVLEGAVAGRRFIAGEHFSAADVYVGSIIDFMMRFGLLDAREAFTAYIEPLRERAAYRRAQETSEAAAP
ncbi:MAG: glutathione S-transferase family protein [Sphingomonadales bacterium]|nr:glutathione S-transferase family protein [Sphingomonadales bacterium]